MTNTRKTSAKDFTVGQQVIAEGSGARTEIAFVKRIGRKWITTNWELNGPEWEDRRFDAATMEGDRGQRNYLTYYLTEEHRAEVKAAEQAERDTREAWEALRKSVTHWKPEHVTLETINTVRRLLAPPESP